MWNIFKVSNKDTRVCKVNNKVKNKDNVDVVLASFLLTLSTFHFFTSSYSVSIVDFEQLIAGWGCCLFFWRFVPAGIDLSKVSTYENTR